MLEGEVRIFVRLAPSLIHANHLEQCPAHSRLSENEVLMNAVEAWGPPFYPSVPTTFQQTQMVDIQI